MPPKTKINEKEVIAASLDIVRKDGIDALNARRLAETLSCSTQPIFSNFASMRELRASVISAASELYESYIVKEIQSNRYPAYKASGMAYINFAREEKELFKLLFMRNRRGEDISGGGDDIRPILEIIMNNLDISEDEALKLHIKLWIYVHGIASMLATEYLDWNDEFISESLSEAYQGLIIKYKDR